MSRPRRAAGGRPSSARDSLPLFHDVAPQEDFTTCERVRSIDAKALQKLRHPANGARLAAFLEDMPSFLEGTFLWSRLGYRYAAPPPADLDPERARVAGEPWLELCAILEGRGSIRHPRTDPLDSRARYVAPAPKRAPRPARGCGQRRGARRTRGLDA